MCIRDSSDGVRGNLKAGGSELANRLPQRLLVNPERLKPIAVGVWRVKPAGTGVDHTVGIELDAAAAPARAGTVQLLSLIHI